MSVARAVTPGGTTNREALRRGLSWNVSAQIGTQAFQFVIQVGLARLLTPGDFGAFAIALVVVAWSGYMFENGFAMALVPSGEAEGGERAASLILNTSAALTTAMILFLLADTYAELFDSATAAPMVRVMAIPVVVQASTSVQRALLRRSLRFRSLFVVDVVPVLVSGPVALLLASRGQGAMSLAWSQATAEILTGIVLILYLPRIGLGRPTRHQFASVGSFGRHWIVSESLGYFTRTSDNLMVGASLGDQQLGLYTRAFSIMTRPVAQLQSVVGTVAFPILSRMHRNHQDALPAFSAGSSALMWLATGPLLVVALLAHPLVDFLFGAQWAGTSPILQILAVATVLQIASAPGGWMLQATGFVRDCVAIALVTGVVSVGGFLVAVKVGEPEAFAVAHAFGGLGTLGATGYYLARRLHLGPVHFALPVAEPIAVSAVSLVLGLAMARLFHSSQYASAFGIMSGITLYIVLGLTVAGRRTRALRSGRPPSQELKR